MSDIINDLLREGSFDEAIERLQNNQTKIVVAPKLAGVGLLHKKKYKERCCTINDINACNTIQWWL